MISVIVPAHNESSVIARTLRAMTDTAASNELDIIVVCNGCKDDTAEIARSFGPPVRVIETPNASKSSALNLGDRAVRTFPRIYVDADVVLTVDAIRELARALNDQSILAAAPTAHYDISGCSFAVRAFFQVRSCLPSARDGIGGSGVYALSEKGRMRFGDFPSITADDGYVRLQFQLQERKTLPFVHSIVYAPRTLKSLLAQKIRAHYGSYELRSSFPELWNNRGETNKKSLVRLFRYPQLWLSLCVYCFVMGVARWQARRRLENKHCIWERDETSRSTA